MAAGDPPRPSALAEVSDGDVKTQGTGDALDGSGSSILARGHGGLAGSVRTVCLKPPLQRPDRLWRHPGLLALAAGWLVSLAREAFLVRVMALALLARRRDPGREPGRLGLAQRLAVRRQGRVARASALAAQRRE